MEREARSDEGASEKVSLTSNNLCRKQLLSTELVFGQLHAPALNLALTLALTLVPTLAPTLLQFDVHFEVHNGILNRSADLLTLNRSDLLTLNRSGPVKHLTC